jgi:hypothetical protein
MKKSNAILEYGILIIIVVAALAGMYYFLQLHIKGYVKKTTDTTLRRPIPFLWQGGVNINIQNVTNDRRETFNGEIEDKATMDASFTSIQAPVPPYIDVAGLHAQDAPAPGSQTNPKHKLREDRNEVSPED